MKDASQILSEALNERKAVNTAYSLRSIAKDLGQADDLRLSLQFFRLTNPEKETKL